MRPCIIKYCKEKEREREISISDCKQQTRFAKFNPVQVSRPATHAPESWNHLILHIDQKAFCKFLCEQLNALAMKLTLLKIRRLAAMNV